MAQVTIDDPDFHRKRTADARGRVALTKELAGKRVNVVVEVIEDE